MNAYTAMALTNVALIVLMALGIWWTREPWPLIGLLFLTWMGPMTRNGNQGRKEG